MSVVEEIISSELEKMIRIVEITGNDFSLFCEPYRKNNYGNLNIDKIKKDKKTNEFSILLLDSEVACMNQKLLEDFIVSHSNVRSDFMGVGIRHQNIMIKIEDMYNERAEGIRESIADGSYYPKKIVKIGGYEFSVDLGMPLQEKNDKYIECLKQAIANSIHAEVDSTEFNEALASACRTIVLKDNYGLGNVDRKEVKILSKTYNNFK